MLIYFVLVRAPPNAFVAWQTKGTEPQVLLILVGPNCQAFQIRLQVPGFSTMRARSTNHLFMPGWLVLGLAITAYMSGR